MRTEHSITSTEHSITSRALRTTASQKKPLPLQEAARARQPLDTQAQRSPGVRAATSSLPARPHSSHPRIVFSRGQATLLQRRRGSLLHVEHSHHIADTIFDGFRKKREATHNKQKTPQYWDVFPHYGLNERLTMLHRRISGHRSVMLSSTGDPLCKSRARVRH